MSNSQVINADRLVRKLFDLQDKAIPQALARAVNRTAGTVRTRTVRAVSKATGLTQAPVRRRVVISRKATKENPEAVLKITGRPLNLINFMSSKPKMLKRGGVSAKPWGKRRRFPEAFIATMPNGATIVVKRSAAGKAGKKIQKGPWAGKSPHIEAMWGPGIANEAATKAMRAVRESTVKERLPIELERELRYRVSRLLVK